MPYTYLHAAAGRRDVAAIRRILAEAPGNAMAAEPSLGFLPLHMCAAIHGHAAAVELLIASAPEAELCRTDAGDSALYWAARNGHLPAARVLLERSATAPAELIADLLRAQRDPYMEASEPSREKRNKVVPMLLADLLARRALSPADWAALPTPCPGLALPTPCPGLARALPAVLARSPAEATHLVAHLPAAARGRLRALLLSLARLQRRLRLELPESVVRRILAAAPLEEEDEQERCYILAAQRRRRMRLALG
eukprot:scaffold8.g1680.t1